MQKCLFPMKELRVTQGYKMGSHLSVYAMDFGGKDGGEQYLYAPCDMVYMGDFPYNHGQYFQSVNEVLCADGKMRKISFFFAHNDNPNNYQVGEIIKQSDSFYKEGNYSNYGKSKVLSHVHVQVGAGKPDRFKNSKGDNEMYDEMKPEDVFLIGDDTKVLSTTYNDITYNFKYAKDIDFPKVEYTKGTYVTLEAMNLRAGATTKYEILRVADMTTDGKKNATSKDLKADAEYKKGTRFTAQQIVFPEDTSVWSLTPSGHICIKGSTGKIFCEKVS